MLASGELCVMKRALPIRIDCAPSRSFYRPI
ncbi:MAG: hypothetical protein JWR25_1485 [Noviherbaspirillum sp.]|jgi:hypothetical protein|nr:hypothetical protein [Noviherbaspirillum sp.]